VVYDTGAISACLKKRGIKPFIPGKSNRKKKIRHDKKATRLQMLSNHAFEG
jgi:hypothetical protein